MMTYNEFKEIVIREFKNYLPDEFLGLDVTIEKVYKVNTSLDGIILNGGNNCKREVSPIIYINDLYDEYLSIGLSIDEILSNASKKYTVAMKNSNNIVKQHSSLLTDTKNKILDNTVLEVINTEWNKELLKTIPHINYLDLSIIFRCIESGENDNIASFILTNSMMDMLDLDKQDIFNRALTNDSPYNKFKSPTLKQTIEELMCECDIPSSHENEFIDLSTIIITNEKSYWGATAIIRPFIFAGIAKKYGCDLYILPSSLHELIIMPCLGKGDDVIQMVQGLREMVCEVNREVLDIEDRLSDNVYHYDRKKNEIQIIGEVLIE